VNTLVHTLVIAAIVIVVVALGWYLGPGGYVNRNVNKAAWRQNEAGRGNFMTRPIWGKYAQPPTGPHDDDGGQLMTGPDDDVDGVGAPPTEPNAPLGRQG
jgi:hypothetical protein